jgi:hypothetical protein
MEEGKIKNTITRSFELQDYRIEGTELSGFWADLQSKEELIVEVSYIPESKNAFSPEEAESLAWKICKKCDIFDDQLPENIRCEVTFKNLGESIYKKNESDPELKLREIEELLVAYRFYVEYYI